MSRNVYAILLRRDKYTPSLPEDQEMCALFPQEDRNKCAPSPVKLLGQKMYTLSSREDGSMSKPSPVLSKEYGNRCTLSLTLTNH